MAKTGWWEKAAKKLREEDATKLKKKKEEELEKERKAKERASNAMRASLGQKFR